MGKSNKKMGSKKLRIILVIVVVLVVLGGGAAAYFGFIVPSMKKTATTASTDVSGTGYKAVLQQKQSQIDTLVASGNKDSEQQAAQIANSQVVAATQSGNDAYIVDASIAKATVMIQTGQAQQALDSVLLPLDQKYSSNAAYKASIYACIAYAYRELGDATNADKYFSQIQGESFD